MTNLPPPPYNGFMTKEPNELSPAILINRVMSGKKDFRSNAYLEAFSHLSSTDLHATNYSRFEIIKLWNSLQTTPNKVRYFTFSLVDDNPVVIKKVEELYKGYKYAYICHDKDKGVEHKHYHYVLMFPSPRSFASVANDLEIPVTMLQKVYSKKGILDYLTHENDPNKHHYDLSEIHANFDVEDEKKCDDGFPFKEFYFDYCKVREGEITVGQFIDKYKIYCATLNMTTAMQVSERLYNASSTGASLSSRSVFPVPNPCSENSIQTAFSATRPEQVPWLDHGSSFVVGVDSPKARKKPDYRKPNPRSDLND